MSVQGIEGPSSELKLVPFGNGINEQVQTDLRPDPVQG